MYYNPYIAYYQNQVGRGDFDVFRGAPVQYGYGLGSFFSSLFRRVVPLISKGARYLAPKLTQAATTVKPHLLAAAKDVASGVMQDVGQKISSALTSKQEGGGLRRGIKRKRCKKNTSLLKRFQASRKLKKTKTQKRKKRKVIDTLFL